MRLLQEFNEQYLTFYGLVHIVAVKKAIIIAKCIAFALFLLASIALALPELVYFGESRPNFRGQTFIIFQGLTVAYFLVLVAYFILWRGIKLKRFPYFIPYFFASFMTLACGEYLMKARRHK